jgi:hypothetical protein
MVRRQRSRSSSSLSQEDEAVVDRIAEIVECRPAYVRTAIQQFQSAPVALDLLVRIVDAMDSLGTVRDIGRIRMLTRDLAKLIDEANH